MVGTATFVREAWIGGGLPCVPHNPRQRNWRELWHGGTSERGWGGVGRRLDVAGGEVAGEEGDALLERMDGVSEKLVEAALARLTVGGVGGA